MEELLGRQAPYSAPAEQAVVGSMLIDPRCISEVIDKLHSTDFYIEANRDIFDTIQTMFSYGQVIDPVTVLDQMKVRGVFREASSERYLLELMEVTPTAANIGEYAEIIRNRSLMRNILHVANEISSAVYEGSGKAEDMLELSERLIYALRKDRTVGGLLPISRVIANVYEELSKAAESGGGIPGALTGLTDIDNAIMGLGGGDLILVASRPGMGKTSIALNMAFNVAKTSNKTVAIFSLEMTREQLVKRLLANQGLIDGKKLQKGNLSPEEWKRLSSAASVLTATDIRIDDNSTLSVADMNAQCRRIQDLGLVVVDYLQLMQSAGGPGYRGAENRTQAVSDMSRMLKIMAKELNVPVLCLSQLSRANESRQNKRPMLSDLRESGAIEQDADVVIGLYREGYYNNECDNPNAAEAIILKNRRGDTKTIDLLWWPEYTTFVAMEKNRDESYE